jgi:hypothetical protein
MRTHLDPIYCNLSSELISYTSNKVGVEQRNYILLIRSISSGVELVFSWLGRGMAEGPKFRHHQVHPLWLRLRLS